MTSHKVFNTIAIVADVMPAENITFHKGTDGHAYRMRYWLQPTNLSTNYNDYELANTIVAYPSSFLLTYDEDFMELTGFDRAGSDPEFSDGVIEHHGSGTMNVDFYYNRKKYTVNYMDGVYVEYIKDESGKEVPSELEIDDRGQLDTSKEIAYEADITELGNYKPEYTGFTFEGWYSDKSCTVPYKFDTMPLGGVTVYAKWVQKQYRSILTSECAINRRI